MATKKQHYVPQVYLKAWETTVTSESEPEKTKTGVYVFEGTDDQGNRRNKDSVMWKPQIYTVPFDQLFIGHKCPKIYNDFTNQIYYLMRNRSPKAIYGKLGRSIIKTKKSIKKHIDDIDDWEFYYEDGNIARKRAIISDIENLNSYVLEEGFDKCFETNWEKVLNAFLEEMKKTSNALLGSSERIVPLDVVEDMSRFIFMMFCRSPKFDGLGIYSWLYKDILAPISEKFGETMMDGVWHSELYGMIYKNGGHFHKVYEKALQECQMIMFETYEGAGTFITSDNPAFVNRTTAIEVKNETGFMFPLTPHQLIFVARGHDRINTIDYRFANVDTVRHFNELIYRHKINTVVSTESSLAKIL